MRAFRISVAAAAALLIGGCTTYYEVKDPSTDKTYYTTKIEKNRDGSVTFDDDKTGAEVTIQNSETMEVSKDTYKAGVQ